MKQSSRAAYRRPVSRAKATRRCLALLAIATISFPLSPAQAEIVAKRARKALESSVRFLHETLSTSKRKGQDFLTQQAEDPSQRASRVKHVRLCPRRLLLYVGEQFTLVPLPLDEKKEVVHGVAFGWESSDSAVADVASDGSVTALKTGRCSVTASAGNKKDKVSVEVREGRRPFLTNANWDVEHGGDCDDPEKSPEAAPSANEPAISSFAPGSRKGVITPAVVVDPDDPPNVAGAGSTANATGDSRFTPAEVPQGIAGKAKNQLGSFNFGLTIPIFGSGGRGVGAGVALAYNSRTWTKDGNTMVFDYDQGWPAPGFRLNYGRIIPNYDGSGNYLLVEADGTRTPLVLLSGTTYRSNDGRFIDFDTNSNGLSYPDGTVVFYIFNGSKLVPNSIKDINGNSVSISSVTSCIDAQRVEACNCNGGCVRPPRQAINQISDTLGRLATFYYKADGNLAEIRVPGYGAGAPDRTVAKFSYQSLTLAYNFGSMTVTNVPAGNQVDVLRRVYFPDTGRGYVFGPYSGYGMCTKVSMRLGMTDASDGTEVALTEYLFQTTGALSDSPQFTERREWWQGKTDDFGNLQDSTHPAVYTYGRTFDNSITWVIAPNGVKTESTSNSDSGSSQFGLATTEKLIRVSDGAVLSQGDFTYNDRTSTTGLQRTVVITTDDAGNQTKTTSNFGNYGRIIELVESGFPIASVFKPRRRTLYSYVDAASYINLSLRQLVTDVSVYDAKGTTPLDDDTLIARTGFVYDSPDAGWEIQTYGFTQNCSGCSPPPGFATNKINRVERGNVTKLQSWSDATAGTAQINFRRQYDIFGNQLKVEVSCCSQKSVEFRDAPVTSPGTSAMYWSTPFSATDGAASGPILTTKYSYDFNTSFVNMATDANDLVTSFLPDGAMRVRSISQPSGALSETFFADPNYTKDGLVYQSKFSYLDGSTPKVHVTNQWLDGTGRAIRSGSAAGPSPTSFDAVKSIYNDLGRLRKTTNPYIGDSNGNTAGLPNATVYDYDSLSRVVTVTLPDGNTVTTSYSGAVVTVTDQVGRKRQSQVDGLGRLIAVTEQDPSTGALSLATNYGYDALNNLMSVDQGGQTRSFSYDSLSRMTSGTTPEGGTVNVAYVDFGAAKKRTDARNVETHYKYDSLNRLTQVWYTGLNGSDDPNATRPALPAGVAATSDVTIAYNPSSPGNGQVSRIDDGGGFETYSYDSLGRTVGKTRTIDGVNSYQSQYQYNQASQVTLMIYPSGKRVRMNYDSRGRLSGEDKVDAADNVLLKYVRSVAYNVAGQITSLGIGEVGPNNAITESYGYNAARLQLTTQSVVNSTGTNLISLTYGYQAAVGASGAGTTAGNSGQLMSITGTINGAGRGEGYTYDDLGRLASASGFYAQRNYSYDRWGNRTGVSGASTQNIILQQQQGAPAGIPNNRITSVNGLGYAYDASGNLISDGAHTYQYDGEGRIATVDSGTAAGYFYDSANRRVKKIAGGVTTYYVWGGSQVIAEYSDAPAGAGGTSYYLADRFSTRVITDSSGVKKGTQDHLPFGEDSGTSTGQVEKHRFTSYERDSESNTDYAVNRQYSQNTGRFNRPDPVTGSISTPQSLNRYSYVNNDPINSTDPLGLEAVWGLYRGTFLGGGGGSGGADYAFWGGRIVDLPGFGTQWGSLSEFFEGQWNSRLRNTFDRAAASRAWNSGNYGLVAAILNGNSNVGVSVGGTVYWGALGAAFATGYGDASLIAGDSRFSLDNPVMAGVKAVLDLLKKLRKPDFFLVNVAVGAVQVTVSVLRGGKLPDNLVGAFGGATGTEISVFAGWLLQLTKPTNDEISSFLTGYSWSLDVFVWKGVIGAGVGFGYIRSPMNDGVRNAVLLGGGVGGGFAFGYGFTYDDLLKRLKP